MYKIQYYVQYKLYQRTKCRQLYSDNQILNNHTLYGVKYLLQYTENSIAILNKLQAREKRPVKNSTKYNTLYSKEYSIDYSTEYDV